MRVTVVRGPSPAGPFELREGENSAGRAPECELFLPSKRVSRRHAVFVVTAGRVEVRDLGSHNGILAGDGRRVATLPLAPGERVQVGDYLLALDGPPGTAALDDSDDDADLDLEEDDILLDDDTAEEPERGRIPPPPPSLPFAARPGLGFGPATPAAPPTRPAPAAAPKVAPAVKPAPKPVAAAPTPVAAAPKPVAPAPKPIAAAPKPVAPAPKPVAPASKPVAPAPKPVAAAPKPVAPVPPPPLLPFTPGGGFGAPPQPRAVPDPSRSLFLEPGDPAYPNVDDDDGLALDESPPPAWTPADNASAEPTASVPAREPEPTVSVPSLPRAGLAATGAAPAPPPPFVAAPLPPPPAPRPPSPAGALPFGPPAGGFAAAARPEPARPSGVPDAPPPPPTLRTAARPAEEPSAAPPPPRPRAPLPQDGTAARGAGIPWLLQATLLALAVVGLVLCAPFGGIFSLIQSRSAGLEEVSVLRGVALAESLANRNAQPLAEQRGLALDTAFMLERDGVRAALVADKTGTVMAPAEKLRTSVAALPAFAEASQTGEVVRLPIEEGRYQIVAPMRAQAGGVGPRQIVGYALLEYDPAAVTESVANPLVAIVAGLFVAGAVAGLLVVGAWWLVLRPLAALREETELALLGDQHDVVSPVRMPQLEQLAHSINRAVTRARSAGAPRPR